MHHSRPIHDFLRVAALGTAFITVGFVMACGARADRKIAAPTPSSNVQRTSATSSDACTAGHCPAVTLYYDAIGLSPDDSRFVATVGEPVLWELRAFAEDEDRQAAIIVLEATHSGISWDTMGQAVALNFTPQAIVNGTIKFLVRDMDKCAAERGQCDAQRLLPDFDKQESIGFYVENPAPATTVGTASTSAANPTVVRVSDPTCNGRVATSDAAIQSSILQTGLKVLTGGPGSLIQLGIGVLSGGLSGGNSGNQQANPC